MSLISRATLPFSGFLATATTVDAVIPEHAPKFPATGQVLRLSDAARV
jgi:hypothetical protein